ncbi:DUF732 domain-containing protein [Mycobacterium sp. WUMAC-067]|nr:MULTISPECIES: DUF732 domain-containing protein [Mycobacterium]MCA2245842.1 DUF732 domain-containing protein [Mycobacterium sp. WUMAC-067]MCA2317359.1 DUF732 domain-containing protein [Mycobacterium sp. WUMAC-025]MEE3754837.1 DUF732 domain-containing protein [Mycobacterium intracellulare]
MSCGKWLTTSVLLLVAALQFATPASADQTDDDFLAALRKHGIVFTNRDAAIATGHRVCSGLDADQTPANLILSLVKDTDLSAHVAGYFFGAAVNSYCPQHRPVIPQPGA